MVVVAVGEGKEGSLIVTGAGAGAGAGAEGGGEGWKGGGRNDASL